MAATQWVPSVDLGGGLRQAGFLPLPLADNVGTLIGTQLWRTRSPGLVECIQLYRSGLALAMRVVAEFTYARPHEYGRVVDHRFGRVEDALAWLILSPPETGDLTCSEPTSS